MRRAPRRTCCLTSELCVSQVAGNDPGATHSRARIVDALVHIAAQNAFEKRYRIVTNTVHELSPIHCPCIPVLSRNRLGTERACANMTVPHQNRQAGRTKQQGWSAEIARMTRAWAEGERPSACSHGGELAGLPPLKKLCMTRVWLRRAGGERPGARSHGGELAGLPLLELRQCPLPGTLASCKPP